MKKLLISAVIGACVGGALLPVYFLLDASFYFSDWAFFLGLPLLLIGLLLLLRSGPSQRFSGASTGSASAAAQVGARIQAAYEDHKAMSDPKVARRERGKSLAPVGAGMIAAGVVDLIVALIVTFLL